jgi:hypothetical protein
LFLASDNERRTVFHAAAKSCELEVIRGIFIWAIQYLTTEEVNKLYFATDNEGRSIFLMASNFCGL